MTWDEAGRLRDQARHSGVAADRMGLPPRANESWTWKQPDAFVVFWLNGRDFEFSDKEQADKWLTDLLGRSPHRSPRAAGTTEGSTEERSKASI